MNKKNDKSELQIGDIFRLPSIEIESFLCSDLVGF